MKTLKWITTPDLLAELQRRADTLYPAVRKGRIMHLIAMAKHDAATNANETIDRALTAYRKPKNWKHG